MAVAGRKGPSDVRVDGGERDPHLRHYHWLLAVRGELLRDLGRHEDAAGCFRAALEHARCEPERRFLRRRLEACAIPKDA